MTLFSGIFHNTILISALTAWLVAQLIKVLINFSIHRTFDFYFLISSGGFPSSHAATVCALCVGIGKYYGWDSPILAVAAVLAMITMYDAAGVRREAGKQAEVINQLVEGLYHQLSDLSQERLKELIGHTPLEVFAGAIVGTIVGIIV